MRSISIKETAETQQPILIYRFGFDGSKRNYLFLIYEKNQENVNNGYLATFKKIITCFRYGDSIVIMFF